MSPVSRATTAGRIYLDLQQLARTTRRPTDELLRTYVLERFLWRVGQSTHRDRLILKGGLLMAAFGERRPTADVDLLARDLSSDREIVSAMVASIANVESDDGVVFAVDDLAASSIRGDENYPGVRVKMPARIDRAKSILRVDVNVGDPVTPAPVLFEYPGLLGEPFPVAGYPFETVLAEKIATMIDRGALTTRERDFADVYLLTGRLRIEADTMTEALAATLRHRKLLPRSVRSALTGLAEQRQGSWTSFVAGAGLSATVPSSFSAAINAVVAFAEPIVAGEVSGRVWEPTKRSWVEYS
ncbi:MAG: nucleotidyl transferase AbiEii/AbiGii toxin family protein [Candidatus Microthrix subdominans]